ncbi:MAG: TrkA family potassium uptake protein [Haloarculaceae archaeon]
MSGKKEVVIVGAGRVGRTAIQQVADHGHGVVVIDRDEAQCNRLADDYVATIIRGDGTDPSILEQADLEQRDVVGALTGETGTNLAICLVAKQLNPDVRTVVRIDRESGEQYTRFADVVVYPERAGGRLAANALLGDEVQSLEEAPGDLELMYVTVAEGAPAAGTSLQEISLPAGALVISTEDGNGVATAETTLTPGDRYLLAVEPGVADEVLNLLRG